MENNGNEVSEAYIKIDVAKESCIDCHKEMQGFSAYHDPKQIGCVVCHLGDASSSDKDISHRQMVLIPGNLEDAELTCGKCHPQELEKIQHSLMTTNSGLVAVDKYIFGETDSPDHHFDIRELAHTASDEHLRNLCANCHLGKKKSEFGAITELSRGGGCNACHLNYSDQAAKELTTYLNSGKTQLTQIHPSTDVFMNDTHCFGCHSRSSRISTNYMGWHETLLDELPASGAYKMFEDKRIYEFKGADVHHSKGLLCIDCHSSHEVMGDGIDYTHEEDAVKLECADCHYKNSPKTIPYDELDAESALVFMHRGYTHFDHPILVSKADGHPLVNTYLDENGVLRLIGKKDGKEHEVVKQGAQCAKDAAHQSLSCASCHSGWAPKCIGCHNSYDTRQQGYDLLDEKLVKGTWIEHVYEFETSLPAMGVREKEGKREIEPAIPGMILSIDDSNHPDDSPKNESFDRLYASNAPHTIQREARSCTSCHSDPEAIGYGKGNLVYSIKNSKAVWAFEPAYELNSNDQLPEDAWIPFLIESNAARLSTRSDFRPFNLKEQQNILRVGACLECHSPNSKMMKQSLLIGLKPLLLERSEKCLIPEY
ncbi:hypothetical protein [Lutimonas sp.]|uniref:hypothetical protein n=1 Tax=Lutimonas sp. TaxID=1872403 RepID=UPI003D9B6794